MTPEQIRVEATRRLVRHLAWDSADEESATAAFGEAAAEMVDALGDLLPVGQEWGLRTVRGVRVERDGQVLHLRVAEAGTEPTICKRWVHGWVDAS
ncbi:hypothetical protein AB0H71_13860 [Nocardia sp. NPDC050697]|uniref:hypothetical protein n=1 Tax=Nocardia sp. NPDC050697 TaxID=3155158 RepID=UPI0034010CCC